mgnify:CR=1 FL=1
MQGVCQFYDRGCKARYAWVSGLFGAAETAMGSQQAAPACSAMHRWRTTLHSSASARQQSQRALAVCFDIRFAQVLRLIFASHMGGGLIAVMGVERYAALAYRNAAQGLVCVAEVDQATRARLLSEAERRGYDTSELIWRQ